MGENQKIIIINNIHCYLVKEGHNNSDLEAFQIASKKHFDKMNKEVEFYRKEDIRDENGSPIHIMIDKDIHSFKVFDLDED